MISIADIDSTLQAETSISDYFSEDSYNGNSSLLYENDDISINIVVDSDDDLAYLSIVDFEDDEVYTTLLIEDEDAISDIPQEISSACYFYSKNFTNQNGRSFLKRIVSLLQSDGIDPDVAYEPTSIN